MSEGAFERLRRLTFYAECQRLDVAFFSIRTVARDEFARCRGLGFRRAPVRIEVMHPSAARMSQGKSGVRRNGGVEGPLCTRPRREHQVDAVSIG